MLLATALATKINPEIPGKAKERERVVKNREREKREERGERRGREEREKRE